MFSWIDIILPKSLQCLFWVRKSSCSILHFLPDVASVGLALDVQLLPEHQSIPSDASDSQLDALVVGNGVTIRRTKSVGQGIY